MVYQEEVVGPAAANRNGPEGSRRGHAPCGTGGVGCSVINLADATVTEIDHGTIRLGVAGEEGILRFADIPLPTVAACVRQGQVIRVREVGIEPGGVRKLSLQGMLPDPWEIARSRLVEGDVVEGRVQVIKPYGAFVELLPRVRGLLHISEIDWDGVADISDHVAPGDIVEVEVLSIDIASKRIGLSRKRTYGGAVKRWPSLVPGGLPFSWKNVSANTVAHTTPARVDRERIAELEAEVEELREAREADERRFRDRLREEERRRDKAKKRARRLEEQLAKCQRALEAEHPLASETAFLCAVRVAYARMFSEDDRMEYPLRKMRVGSSFLDSVRAVEGVDIHKIVEVCAQVACSAAVDIQGRQVKRLRAGSRGSPNRVRERDGAQAWRCALQINTPAARRLHYWHVPGDDVIEFAAVVVHDDFDIPESTAAGPRRGATPAMPRHVPRVTTAKTEAKTA